MSDHIRETPADSARRAAVAAFFGHPFHDGALLLQACTHNSRLGAQATPAEKRRLANERMEFLGDALLGAAFCQWLYETYPDADEGALSRLKSRMVSRATLAKAMDASGMLEHCLVGGQMFPPWPDSVKANFAEAILAAVFFDGGWPALRVAVDRLLRPFVEDPLTMDEDARMRLQVHCLEQFKQLPTYTSERIGGTDHEPLFAAQATISGHSARGEGTSRRRAEAAAANALMTVLTSTEK
jgi:ribonuclease III